MIKYLVIPLILVGCTAPVTDPPAHALEVEEKLMWEMIEKIQNYRPFEQKTDPDDSINSALENFWEDLDGSNDTTESEELLQLSSNED
tara:strand:- start:158 stop:421 length:264 start_codon:yes stop_codon:yes gene_type:complete